MGSREEFTRVADVVGDGGGGDRPVIDEGGGGGGGGGRGDRPVFNEEGGGGGAGGTEDKLLITGDTNVEEEHGGGTVEAEFLVMYNGAALVKVGGAGGVGIENAFLIEGAGATGIESGRGGAGGGTEHDGLQPCDEVPSDECGTSKTVR